MLSSPTPGTRKHPYVRLQSKAKSFMKENRIAYSGQTKTENWHALYKKSVIKKLHTDSLQGLSSAEAGRRLRQQGLNTLQTLRKPAWYVVMARQFVNVLIIILMAAALECFIYVVMAICVLRLRKRYPDKERSFRVPFGPVVPVITAVVFSGLMIMLPEKNPVIKRTGTNSANGIFPERTIVDQPPTDIPHPTR